MGDLNPLFSFDLGGSDIENNAQAPWELTGALAQAERGGPGSGVITSIDDKIAQQLAFKQRLARWAGKATGSAADRGRKQQTAPSGSEDEEEEEEEEGGGSEEEEEEGSDAPLPGELDESDDEDADVDLEAAAAASDDGEEEAGEEEGEEDEIARAVMDMDSDDLEMMSSDEEEEEEQLQQQQPQQAAAGKRKREQQQQQQQQQAQQAAERQPRRGAAGAADGGGDAAAAQHAQAAPGSGKRLKGFFDAAPKDTKFSAKAFADLKLSRPLLKACEALGYVHPTPIQSACVPLALAGRDICASAVTGSGKTAAFALPILERLLHRNKRVAATYVLVLTPVHSMIQKIAQFTDIRAALVVGGLSLQAQAAALREQPEIVVATPGRLIDHLRNTQSVGLEDLAVLVLDEADRLLEMGFAEEIREVVKMAPAWRQTMLFSATMTEEVKKLVALSLNHPVRLAADAKASAPKLLTQEIMRLKGAAAAQKEAALLALCSKSFREGRTIIFAKTKQRAHRLKILFGLAGLPPAGELHGDMTQAARLESLERFRKGEVAFLLATDVAARGLDILGVEAVVNYDCPKQLSSYLHRVGRTARAGAKGRALTFIEDDDRTLLKEVIRRTGVQVQQRTVQQAATDTWQAKIEKLEPQVDAIIWQEREERALRKAEMEVQKATNMLEHEDEIKARPPRTWFQTEKQKRELAKASKEAAANGVEAGSDGEEGEEGDDMSNKQKKNKSKNERRLEQKQARAKEAAQQRKGKNKLMEETAAASRGIRAVKAREQQLRLEGMTGGKAGKIAASLVTGIKRSKKAKKKGKGTEEGGEGELFSGDGLPGKPSGGGPSSVYAGGARSGKVKPPKSGGKSKSEMNRVKRGGKGKHGFKSKAKHKRRVLTVTVNPVGVYTLTVSAHATFKRDVVLGEAAHDLLTVNAQPIFVTQPWFKAGLKAGTSGQLVVGSAGALTAPSATIDGALRVTGPLTVYGATTLGGADALLKFRGPAIFKRGFVSDEALVVTSLTASGPVTAGSMTVTGSLRADGATTLGGAAAPLRFNGPATFTRGFTSEEPLFVPSLTSMQITAGSMTVTGPLMVDGATFLGGAEAPLTVHGPATFKHGFTSEEEGTVPSLTSSGPITAGSMSVTGPAAVSSLSVTSRADVAGELTASSAAVAGLTTTQRLSVTDRADVARALTAGSVAVAGDVEFNTMVVKKQLTVKGSTSLGTELQGGDAYPVVLNVYGRGTFLHPNTTFNGTGNITHGASTEVHYGGVKSEWTLHQGNEANDSYCRTAYFGTRTQAPTNSSTSADPSTPAADDSAQAAMASRVTLTTQCDRPEEPPAE
ncbi:DEAD-box ATP-dependent RNA helicase 28 [Micractinium conductrix]|uniref:DEAD-box ATP-dependent RNA helicase 28 n=1 Tax=Micractinium conductrix TaxID=554055 RepID=A0A2P6V4F3_9CHLO|nr:DEAD-box ATP-dependent RNA helicase 28 [Micractinium conductrix]|eukprot:PSC68971.1 DEAD-box ATP-dependent RNA helicase 28 [Micractinium conductrix]